MQSITRHPYIVARLSIVDTDTSIEDPLTTFEDPGGTLYIFSSASSHCEKRSSDRLHVSFIEGIVASHLR